MAGSLDLEGLQATHTHDEFFDFAPRMGTSCAGKDVLIGLGLRCSSAVHK